MSVSPGRTYRYYDGNKKPPLYWFGHGLSYNTFAYTNLKVTPSASLRSGNHSLNVSLAVDIDVTCGTTFPNNSDHVVMIYVTASPDAATDRDLASLPKRQLIGFQRVTLAPGETRTVTVNILASRLRLVDAMDQYQLIQGTYKMWIGNVDKEEVVAHVTVTE